MAKIRDGSEHRLPIVEPGPKSTGVKQAHVLHLQEDFKIPELLCVRAKEGCKAPATELTGRVLYLKSGHAVSIISAEDYRLGGAFPRVVSMGDDTLSPAVEWQRG